MDLAALRLGSNSGSSSAPGTAAADGSAALLALQHSDGGASQAPAWRAEPAPAVCLSSNNPDELRQHALLLQQEMMAARAELRAARCVARVAAGGMKQLTRTLGV
jgi:hypothetical protein